MLRATPLQQSGLPLILLVLVLLQSVVINSGVKVPLPSLMPRVAC